MCVWCLTFVSECVSVIAALDCVSLCLCVGDIKVLISAATQHQCHCEGTKQHRPQQNLPTKMVGELSEKCFLFFFHLAFVFLWIPSLIYVKLHNDVWRLAWD